MIQLLNQLPITSAVTTNNIYILDAIIMPFMMSVFHLDIQIQYNTIRKDTLSFKLFITPLNVATR